ncbi:MAG TPA: hypothetical protein VGV92_03290 [Gammaproteobacteria bacterium]|nr:hypothetical protein [Gammaproteobacteria bacterium]
MVKIIVPIIAVLFSTVVFAQDKPEAAKPEPKFVMTQPLADALQPVNGKVLETKTFGNVTVVHASVTGADHSDAYFIVAKDKVFDIDDYSNLSQLNLKSQPSFAQLAQKYPNIGIWPGSHMFPKSETLAGGVTQLIFTYSLLNGCHACELGGIANVGFNFDKDGNYLGEQLLALSPPPYSASK